MIEPPNWTLQKNSAEVQATIVSLLNKKNIQPNANIVHGWYIYTDLRCLLAHWTHTHKFLFWLYWREWEGGNWIGSLMVWCSFNASGTLPLKVVSIKINSADYIKVLKDSLAPLFKKIKIKDVMILLQCTKAKRLSKVVNVASWPTCFLDQKPIENLWGNVSRKV